MASAEEIPSSLLRWQQSYKSDNERISFLDLALELRDFIYSYAFELSPLHIMFQSKSRSWSLRNEEDEETKPGAQFAALLQTCRQVHAEASPVLFGMNVIFSGINEEELSNAGASDEILAEPNFLDLPKLYLPHITSVRLYCPSTHFKLFKRYWNFLLKISENLAAGLPSLSRVQFELDDLTTATLCLSAQYCEVWADLCAILDLRREAEVDVHPLVGKIQACIKQSRHGQARIPNHMFVEPIDTQLLGVMRNWARAERLRRFNKFFKIAFEKVKAEDAAAAISESAKDG